MEPHDPPPGIPPEPPPVPAPIDRRKLWWSLLLPQAFPILGAVTELAIGASGGSSEGGFLMGGLVLFAIVGIGCWMAFGQIVSARFRGAGMVLMVLGYPLAQIIQMITILVGACFALVAGGGLNF
jgi:hypothetical protein